MIDDVAMVFGIAASLALMYVGRAHLKGPSLPRQAPPRSAIRTTTLAMADVGDSRKRLPDKARKLIRHIEEDAAVVSNLLSNSIGDERAFLARETLARYLPDSLAKYFASTHDLRNATDTVFAETLMRELRALRDGLGSVKNAVLAEYESYNDLDERFIRERFRQ